MQTQGLPPLTIQQIYASSHYVLTVHSFLVSGFILPNRGFSFGLIYSFKSFSVYYIRNMYYTSYCKDLTVEEHDWIFYTSPTSKHN